LIRGEEVKKLLNKKRDDCTFADLENKGSQAIPQIQQNLIRFDLFFL